MNLTHKKLVEIGARWLFTTRGYPVVVTELTSVGEIPDILGWKGWEATEIEVKVSFSDFLADKRKLSRICAETGIAARRYYLVPEELVTKAKESLPEGWGLLCLLANGRSIGLCVESSRFEVDRRKDILFLSSIIRRIAGERRPIKGVQIRCYQDMSFLERDSLIREYGRQGLPVNEKEIDEKLSPRAALLIKPEVDFLSNEQ